VRRRNTGTFSGLGYTQRRKKMKKQKKKKNALLVGHTMPSEMRGNDGPMIYWLSVVRV
jgi:hypothetical protein